MIYLITGGAGFIGSNITKELIKRKQQVIIIDNLSTGKEKNIEPFKKNIKFYKENILNFNKIKKIFQKHKVDYVLHQAAVPSVPRSVDDPISSNRNNIDGILNMLVLARDFKIKKFVFASSSSVYGDSEKLPKVETMMPNPKSPYAVTKLTGEYYCKNFYDLYGLETVSLRYFNVFGPNQNPCSQYSAAIPKFFSAILKGNKPTVYGDGLQSRDFTYIDNVVSANLLAAKVKKLGGVACNVATGKRVTVNESIQVINNILNADIKPKHVKPRLGDVKHSLGDISKSKKLLKYKPLALFEDGIKKSSKWYIKNFK